jgi:nicotinamide-nucleotide amidase
MGSGLTADSIEAPEVVALVQALAQRLHQRGLHLITAESCTGGLMAGACTALAGSSVWFERGLVTYSNAAKTELLGVPAELIARHGAVSEPVARAMALGALAQHERTIALAVTGIAGPGGGVPGKPVGTVWLGWAWRGAAGPGIPVRAEVDGERVGCERLNLPGDRATVRATTVARALQRALALLDSMPA